MKKLKKTFDTLAELDEYVGNDGGNEIELEDVTRIRKALETAMAYENALGLEANFVDFIYDWKIVIQAAYSINGEQKIVTFEP